MSLGACLPGLVAEGKLDAEQAREAGALFDELKQDFRRQFGEQAADAMASDATLQALDAAHARKRFLAARTIATRQRIEADLRSYGSGGEGGGGGGGGPIDPRGGPALFDGDGRATYSNVAGRMRAIRGRAHGLIDGLLEKHSTSITGQLRDKAGLVDLVREAFGEDSGNASAKELAGAWGEAAEMLRRRFNAAGGGIGKLERWGLPQSHDWRSVRAAGFEAWRAEILPRLDRAAMVDERTALPFSDFAIEDALRQAFETIRSDGLNKRDAGGIGVGSLANRRGDPRFFVFKSADDWLAYAEQFGAGSPFDAMMGHIDGMARDVALMEVLGPNPDGSVRWLKDTIAKEAAADTAPDSKAIDRAHGQVKLVDRLYGEITGENNRPENRKLALAFSTLRSWQTATKLGGAMLSAVSDLGFHAVTRKFNGLPAASMLKDYAKLMRPGAAEDQRLAVRLGLIAEEWSNRSASGQRMFLDEQANETTRRLAEGVLRLSGLARWTQAGRWAFGMEFLGHMTEQRGKALSALDPAFRGVLERHGFTAADWDAVRATPLERDRGVDWIKPANVGDAALGDRLLEMIANETDHAVPVPDLRTRAAMNALAPRGTVFGEIARSALLFKSFGISVMLMHGRRAMAMSAPGAAGYVAGLAISTTMMGGLTLLLKDLAAGRDPRKATDQSFWGQAFLQGGGFGIFGDFLRSADGRSGNGFAGTLAGPLVSDAQGLAKIATSSNPAGAAVKAARAQLPGGTLWYARLALDRMVGDQVQQMADPHYRDSWRNMARWAREQGTQSWWSPGELAPERGPDLENAISVPEGSTLQ